MRWHPNSRLRGPLFMQVSQAGASGPQGELFLSGFLSVCWVSRWPRARPSTAATAPFSPRGLINQPWARALGFARQPRRPNHPAQRQGRAWRWPDDHRSRFANPGARPPVCFTARWRNPGRLPAFAAAYHGVAGSLVPVLRREWQREPTARRSAPLRPVTSMDLSLARSAWRRCCWGRSTCWRPCWRRWDCMAWSPTR